MSNALKEFEKNWSVTSLYESKGVEMTAHTLPLSVKNVFAVGDLFLVLRVSENRRKQNHAKNEA